MESAEIYFDYEITLFHEQDSTTYGEIHALTEEHPTNHEVVILLKNLFQPKYKKITFDVVRPGVWSYRAK